MDDLDEGHGAPYHELSEDEAWLLASFLGQEPTPEYLGICDPAELKDMSPVPAKNDNPIDPAQASREELVNYLLEVFEYCASYHGVFTRKMLAMLSNVLLRHLTNLIQELVDPDVCEKRWKDRRANGDTPLPITGDRETDFNLTPSDDDAEMAGEITAEISDSSIVIDPKDLLVANLDPEELTLADSDDNMPVGAAAASEEVPVADLILDDSDDSGLMLSDDDSGEIGDRVLGSLLTEAGPVTPPPLRRTSSETPPPLFQEKDERWSDGT